MYNLPKRKEIGQLLGHTGTITTLAVHGEFLFSGGDDGEICIWLMKKWSLLQKLKGHKKPIADFVVHSSGKMLISIDRDGKFVLWNLMTARKAYFHKFPYRNTHYL